MNIETDLVIIKNVDKTTEVEFCREEENRFYVKYPGNDTVYSYNKDNVVRLYNPEVFDGNTYIVYENGVPLQRVNKILFFQQYYRVIFQNERHEIYPSEAITLEATALSIPGVKQGLRYLTELSEKVGLKLDDGTSLLKKQFDKLTHLSPQSVLSVYLGGKPQYPYQEESHEVIYPFGFNTSQKTATIKAMTEQISVIEGPPGTGKTQTILNIIANALLNQKTVAIVSNNNAATKNVMEKLEKADLSFIAAFLGSNENIDQFFAEQHEFYPKMDDWTLEKDVYDALIFELGERHATLDDMLAHQQKQAKLKQEMSEIKAEYAYFLDYENGLEDVEMGVRCFRRLHADHYLQLLVDYDQVEGKLTFKKKLQYFFTYGMYSFKIFNHPREVVTTYLQKQFYQLKIAELEAEIKVLHNKLETFQFNDAMKSFSDDSMKVFKAALARRYHQDAGEANQRSVFSNDVLWKDYERFISEYPVILSTTHSIRKCAKDSHLFDYVLIDEASQVDIVTGSLALSVAKNAVIVGDDKQLPNVVTDDVAKATNEIYDRYGMNLPYHFAKNSLLTSLLQVLPDVPKTLLQEHYRCHPKIIGFCNQKYYQNELVILTDEQEYDEPLVVYQTVMGNHARGTVNERQVDVILKEVMDEQKLDLTEDSIGIVTPYRKQVTALEEANEQQNQDMEIDTVHKYQGREKNVMILSTVVNDMKQYDFADDPNLINVAVSRAVDKLIIVTAYGSEQWRNTNVGDLIGYVKYHNHEVITSEIYSVFDYLYSCYAEKLEVLMQKINQVSEHTSENLMNMVIENVLSEEAFRHLDVILHQPLRMLIKDTSLLSEEEYKYAMNSWTHTDFVIFNKMNKLPILVVEVDGHEYHANDPAQLERDRMKDRILYKYQIPIVRMKTTGSEEEKVLRELLKKIG
ncbi:MAG TPA: AAA domain-containing protein [Pseudogracilibacillus sp.]|nr:AAA domain-containing protein [Pseudogracilibacillus sp.]